MFSRMFPFVVAILVVPAAVTAQPPPAEPPRGDLPTDAPPERAEARDVGEAGLYDAYDIYDAYAGYDLYGGFDGEPGEDDWYYDYYDLGYGYDDWYLDYTMDTGEFAKAEARDDRDDLDDREDLGDLGEFDGPAFDDPFLNESFGGNAFADPGLYAPGGTFYGYGFDAEPIR